LHFGWLITRIVILGAAASACGDAGEAGAPGPVEAVLEPPSQTIRVNPGGTEVLQFVLRTPAGAPVPSQRVSFAIVDYPETPESEAQGATLSTDGAVTDAAGIAETRVTGGLPAVFRVRASSLDDDAEVEVVVATAMVGSLEVAPFLPAGSSARTVPVSSVEVMLFNDNSCSGLSPLKPPMFGRSVRSLPEVDAVALFPFVGTDTSHAIVGRAFDGKGVIRAAGCTDVPGTALLVGGVVRITLPLPDASPSPVGRYAVTSSFTFTAPLAAAQAAAAPWNDLQDCPLDPAQLWLDCTIDALGVPSPDDPDDCRPAAMEADPGPALSLRRGMLSVTAGVGGTTFCRMARDAAGNLADDAMVMALFPSPAPAPLAALPAIAEDAARILRTLSLKSELTVEVAAQAGSGGGQYLATHRLTAAGFLLSAGLYEVPLTPLGLPGFQATHVPAAEREGALHIATHTVALRLGTASRIAFGESALARRGQPTRALDFVNGLTGRATFDDGPVKRVGCAALDAFLCQQIGRASGCLGTACTEGLTTLATRLDAGFDQANGDGLDFALAGSAPLLDTHSSGTADKLGDAAASTGKGSGGIGTWSAELRNADRAELFGGSWFGVRTGN
jgi:hypothetical protein